MEKNEKELPEFTVDANVSNFRGPKIIQQEARHLYHMGMRNPSFQSPCQCWGGNTWEESQIGSKAMNSFEARIRELQDKITRARGEHGETARLYLRLQEVRTAQLRAENAAKALQELERRKEQ